MPRSSFQKRRKDSHPLSFRFVLSIAFLAMLAISLALYTVIIASTMSGTGRTLRETPMASGSNAKITSNAAITTTDLPLPSYPKVTTNVNTAITSPATNWVPPSLPKVNTATIGHLHNFPSHQQVPKQPQGVRDMTNGRGWIPEEENKLMKERLEALKSLRAIKAKPVTGQHMQQNLQARRASLGQQTQSIPQVQTVAPVQQSQASVPETQAEQAKAAAHSTGMASVQRPFQPRTEADIQYCRDRVFTTQGAPITEVQLDRSCNDPTSLRFNVCHDLADFTGLTMDEVIVRMARMKHFHFEEEHMFWNPQSTTELAWYYSTSQSYLFANAIHGAPSTALNHLKKDIHEPVLDYSGGVGNSCLYLVLERKLQCQYFGIGMIEKAFAQFRVAKRNLQHMITFVSPWSEQTGWRFDPVQALPRDGSLGAILAQDVLEHIPNYHVVVAAMVDSLKLGGVILEQSPFAQFQVAGPDTRIHVYNGGVTMAQAMGDRMVFHEEQGYWEKIKS